ncbi:MAG TPA: hypothetical protein VN888_20610 [Mycobacterium sp.]|nr:hypothetical protein [Mycobacterium sp.]
MRRDQLEHAIRAACQITGQTEVIVVGSQAILGTYPEYELPSLATSSLEIDILPITDDNDETMRLADLIVGVAGEFSQFEQTHGFSIDGVDLTTSALPEGWRTRLVKVQNENTAAPAGHPQYIGSCLDKEDLCGSTFAASRRVLGWICDASSDNYASQPSANDAKTLLVVASIGVEPC